MIARHRRQRKGCARRAAAGAGPAAVLRL